MPPHINLQSSTGTPIFYWKQLHMKEDQIGEHGTYTTLSLAQGLEGGSWSRIPAPFSRESRIPHVFHQFPESHFSFPEKYIKKSNLVSANPVKVFKCVTQLKRSLCSPPLSGTLNFSLGIGKVLALELSSVAAR